MKEVKNLIISAPNHATGYRLSDGFYIEWFSGSKSEGWSLISSSHHDIRSVDTSKPVIEIERPRTKTEFVKCEYGEKVSNIVMDFENSAPLYKLVNDEHWTIDELDDLFNLILNDCYIYRKVEVEIDERQEFIEAAKEIIDGSKTAEYSLGAMFDSGRFKLVE